MSFWPRKLAQGTFCKLFCESTRPHLFKTPKISWIRQILLKLQSIKVETSFPKVTHNVFWCAAAAPHCALRDGLSSTISSWLWRANYWFLQAGCAHSREAPNHLKIGTNLEHYKQNKKQLSLLRSMYVSPFSEGKKSAVAVFRTKLSLFWIHLLTKPNFPVKSFANVQYHSYQLDNFTRLSLRPYLQDVVWRVAVRTWEEH